MIRVQCPHCEAKLKVGDGSAGSRVTCPKCRGSVRVPEAEDREVEDEPPAAKPARRAGRRPPTEEEEEPLDVLPANERRSRDDDDDDDRPRRRPPRRRKRRRYDEDGGGGLSARNILFGGAIAFLGVLQILGGLTNENPAFKVLGPLCGLGFIAGGVLYAMRR